MAPLQGCYWLIYEKCDGSQPAVFGTLTALLSPQPFQDHTKTNPYPSQTYAQMGTRKH